MLAPINPPAKIQRLIPSPKMVGSRSALDTRMQLNEIATDLERTICHSDDRDSQNCILSEALGLKVGDEVGRYLLLSSLGAGGMGVVFRAYDPALDRKVAIKFVQSAPNNDSSNTLSHSESRSRLLQEAQFMAQLGHPNVVTIFDVGEIRSLIYLAMELVEGQTLKHWIRAENYKWPQAVNMFIQAGKGLAAAHDLGLVHRDFKPDNVLLGTDGRVCVADFGLVCHEQKSPISLLAAATNNLWPAATTQTKLVIGTPYYMSPEQHRGKVATPLSDQFSFCTSLYEAIYGVRPFFGRTLQEIYCAIEEGQLTQASESRNVPSWLHHITLRGLSLNPADRFPSMHMLLAELEARSQVSRKKFLWGSIVGLGVLAVVSGHELGRSPIQDPCSPRIHGMEKLWDKKTSLMVRSQFSNAGLPYADSSFSTIDRILSQRVNDWGDAYSEMCQSTSSIDHADNDRDLTAGCLQDQLEQTQTFVEMLKTADATIVEKSVSSVHSLNPITACEDIESLKHKIPLPKDPRLRSEVTRLRQQIDRARVLRSVGKLGPANDLASELVEKAEITKFRPLLAESYLMMAEFHSADFQDRIASQWLEKAKYLAEAGVDDAVATSLGNLGIFVDGYRLQKTQGIEGQIAHVHAHLLRAGSPPLLQAKWLACAGAVYGVINRLNEAEVAFRESLELFEKHLGAGHEKTLIAYNDLAVTLTFLQRYEEAEFLYRRLLAVGASSLGEMHPALALPLGNLALLLGASGQFEDSIKYATRSADIHKTTHGTNPSNNFLQNGVKALLMLQTGDYFRSAQLWRQIVDAFGDNPVQTPDLVLSLNESARANIRLGRFERARSTLNRVDFSQINSDNHALRVHTVSLMIECALAQGKVMEALSQLKKIEKSDLDTALASNTNAEAILVILGDLELARERPQAALEYHLQAYERGLKTFREPNNINLIPHLMALARSSFMTENRQDSALQRNQQAINNILESKNNVPHWLSLAYLQRAKFLVQQSNWPQALKAALLAEHYQVPEEMDPRILSEIADTIALAQRG